jgi:hypothetical protein
MSNVFSIDVKDAIPERRWDGLSLEEVYEQIESVENLMRTFDPVLQFALFNFAIHIERILKERNT